MLTRITYGLSCTECSRKAALTWTRARTQQLTQHLCALTSISKKKDSVNTLECESSRRRKERCYSFSLHTNVPHYGPHLLVQGGLG